MKNLILPFVVLALFAVGSCGDEASVNPPEDGKDTTKNQDTTKKQDSVFRVFMKGKISIAGMPVTFQINNYSSSFFYGTRQDSSISDTVIQYSGSVSHFSTPIIDSIVALKGKDTLQIIERFGINDDRNRKRFSLVIDTLLHSIPYLSYEFIENRSNANGTTTNWSGSSRIIALKNVPYTSSGDSIVIEIKGTDLQSRISHFVWHDANGSYYNGGHASNTSNSHTNTNFKEFIPFTDTTKIRIALFYK
ncbi:MAG TPA: hypothetical protein VEC36_06430 [Patescibacteria group bacterium]|nr:hypothetical protein [Patescibacteria group bacterium]